jgi:lipopolysaccharide/colanic/teichoic acid biosynthesis glycosyltransferase
MADKNRDSTLKKSWACTCEEKVIGLVERVVALVALAFTLPVTILIAFLIKVDSPGPAIFKQTRIGKNRRRNLPSISINCEKPFKERRKQDLGGRPFTFYKFRTMVVDASERFPELYRYEYTPEELRTLYFKIPDDPRLTRFGKHLRKTTLDELPNLINVLKGDLSLVGPRPEIPEMIKYYEEDQKKKFQLKPGVTGLAQINGRGLLSFQKGLEYDVKLVENYGLWMYFKVIFGTIKVTLLRIGAF